MNRTNRLQSNVQPGSKENEIQCYLQKYFSDHMFILHHYCKTNDFIDKQTFENILRSADRLIDANCLESLWNLCQPSDKGISYEIFLQHFAPFELENHQRSIDSKKNNILPSNQCRILNYVTRLSPSVKNSWQNLKDEFYSFDRYGRLFIPIDQAINLMKKYCLPLNDNQQYELGLLFSPKNNGQFYYLDFMQYFTDRSLLKTSAQSIFSRLTYRIQSKQSWTYSLITIDCILNRIRSEGINKYESIYRMFKTMDKNRQGYLTKIEFNQLLSQLDIQLNEEELYHIVSEIDKNQDGVISYEELYYSLITDALQI